MFSNTLCFTGHRSQKLPWGFDENDERCLKMKEKLKAQIEKEIENGYTTFFSGMALGFDLICVELLLELKKKHKHIKIFGAIPCKTQDCKWPESEKIRYNNLLKQLDKVRCVFEKYTGPECMLERNCYMVNHSSKMIALYAGLSGGTKKTIDYAKSQGLEVVIIKP